MAVVRVRKKPVEVTAVQWTGDNVDELEWWTGNLFDRLGPEDSFYSDDPEATAQIFDKLHSTWILMYTGDWVVRGVAGEFHPVRNSVFVDTYEKVAG